MEYAESGVTAAAGLYTEGWSGLERGKDGYPTYLEDKNESGYLIAGGNVYPPFFEPQTLEFYGFSI